MSNLKITNGDKLESESVEAGEDFFATPPAFENIFEKLKLFFI